MRAFVLFWVLPLGAFWGWFFSARADLGLILFSRDVFDRTFAVYEAILGLNSDQVAWLIAKAIVVDSMIILAVLAIRRRKKIIAWVRTAVLNGKVAKSRYEERFDAIAFGSDKMGEPVQRAL